MDEQNEIFRQLMDRLDKIQSNIPGPGFLLFWLGFVPVAGFILALVFLT